jgi:predicted permease
MLGIGARRRLRRHFDVLFRIQFAVGLGLLATLSGWSFDLNVDNLAAIAVLLAAQLGAVSLAARLFRDRGDGPLLAFGMYGNPTFWSLPVATATLGARAAVFLVAYDMLTQPRIGVALRLMRARAPRDQSRRTAFADYAPTAGAVLGLLLGVVVPAPPAASSVVAGLGIAIALFGSLLLGVAWPRSWAGRPEAALTLRGLALHLTFVPGVLLAATLAGLRLPGVVWLLALGPLPTSIVSFARLYGYSTRVAATGLVVSLVVAAALLPVALSIAR